MPELPEVETIRRQAEQLIGMTITGVEYKASKIAKSDLKKVIGEKVLGIRRFGKLLVIDVSGDLSLCVHLKMTGRLLLQDKEAPAEKHMHITFFLGKAKKLTFQDMRKFGYIQLIATNKVGDLPFVKSLGKEALKDLTFADFETIVAKSTRAIKVLLLDQQKIAGIGNIYDNEALWTAKINPQRKANSLRPTERKRLFEAIEAVLKEGIARGGASDSSYVDLLGHKGRYQDFFKVYARAKQPCLRCGTAIKRITLGGRGTFFCPKCQKGGLR